MFIACPQCRYLVATDPRTQSAPARCPRCSAVLDAGDSAPLPASGGTQSPASAGGHSLASLLRRDESPEQGEQTAELEPASEAVSTSNDATPESIVAADPTPDSDPLSDDGQELSTSDNEAPVATLIDIAPADAEEQSTPQTAPADSIVAALPSAPSIKPVRAARAPAFLGGRSSSSASRQGAPLWQWALLVILLLSLALQMLLADRARLAADAGWRPLLSSLCGVLGCSIPAWREPQAFVMLDRDVRPVPNVAGVLQARATFRNDARWSQPWPILLLTLKDADGRDLGARAITPAEYLRGSTAMSELAPGQSAQVAVNLREPSANVVAFSFDFR